MGGRERRREGHPGGAELEQNFSKAELVPFLFHQHFSFVCVCFRKCDSCAFTHTIQNSARNNHALDRKCLIFVLFPPHRK